MVQDDAMILLTCLNYSVEATKIESLLPVSAEEWRKVVDLAHQHKVAPLLYHHIRRMKIELPVELDKELKQVHSKNIFRNMRLFQEMNKLLRWLQSEDIPVIVLKGAYLATKVYDSVGLRTMGDVDLLVKQEDVLRVEQKLLGCGYLPEISDRAITQKNYHFRYLLNGSNFVIEIHWKLLGNNFPFQIDMDGLWGRAKSVTLAQCTTLVLSLEDLLLHLCLHIVKHVYRYDVEYDASIRTLCDIGAVVERYGAELNWQRISTHAHQWGVVCAVYMILRLAQELLGVPVPTDWLDSLRPDSFKESFVLIARNETFAARSDGDMIESDQVQAARLWGSNKLGWKIATIFRSFFQSRESMATMYPAQANSWRIYLYYPIRFKDVLKRHIAMQWRLVRADSKILNQVERTNNIIELHDWLMSG